jgi:uncharacterized radical SAM protein YgiQ
MTELYKKVRSHPRIKKAFVSSGIRYDLIFHESGSNSRDQLNKNYFREIIKYHISGKLKVAPEHTSEEVLKLMRKPSFSLFEKLNSEFKKVNKELGMNQLLIPYFISSHPGCSDLDMVQLAIETKKLNFRLEQVQDFTPTPMTLATVMYYSGYHPYTMEKVYTARTQKAKREQRKFFFWYKKEYRKSILQELYAKGRKDLADQLFK